LIDDRLNPQDLAELVVHLQPVVFDPVLHARTRCAVLLAVGEDFSLKIAMQLASQEGENVCGRQLDRGVVQQPRVEACQLLATPKQQVGAVFRLIDHPVVAA
jgi:hypothetical protein